MFWKVKAVSTYIYIYIYIRYQWITILFENKIKAHKLIAPKGKISQQMWKTLSRGLDEVEMVHNTAKDMLNLDNNNRYRKGVKSCGNFPKFCTANVYFGMDRIMKQTAHCTRRTVQAKNRKYPSIEWCLRDPSFSCFPWLKMRDFKRLKFCQVYGNSWYI